VAISPRAGGGVADAVEREALERMSVVATAALAGARLYERLRALSNELEQKAAARSAALAQALRDLRGAEQRLVESEKLASLGQIVAGVAADLRDCVHEAFDESARLRRQVALLMAKAAEAKAGPDARFDEMARDALPLLDAVSEGARRAYAIAADLSGFAGDDGVPSGTLRAARQATHLAALLDSTLTLCTRHLNDIAVVRDYDEALPMIPVEQGPLSQVVLNLILNATQAMRGSGTLTLSTRRVGEQAELGIGDTGPGIPPEILSRIFEPFFSTKGPTTGTGLGLSISYAIVKRHGGEIVVDTTVGVGTTFRVRLPLAAQAAHD
jgi:signal transduction histidine kinase